MGPFGKRILLFTAATVLLYITGIETLGRSKVLGRALIYRTGNYYQWPGGSSWQRYREYDPGVRRDVVIIGSSHAYRGYDPAVFVARGHSAFNLGSSGQAPLNSRFLIEHYLDSTNAPLLVYDVFEGVFNNTGFESTANLVPNLPGTRASWGMVRSLGDLRGLNILALRLLVPPKAPVYVDSLYQGLGFCPRTDTLRKVPRPMPPMDEDLAEEQWGHFKAAMELCRQRGIQVVVTSHWALPARSRGGHRVFAAQVRQALAGTGIPYVDLTDAPGSTDMDLYADDNHLNAAGAALFTAQLVDSLERRGCLR